MDQKALPFCLEKRTFLILRSLVQLRACLLSISRQCYRCEMRFLPISFLCLFFAAFTSGCLFRSEKQPPIVYQGWNARYEYNVDKRRLSSSFGNKRMGRTWGRSERGLIDYDRWWGGGPFVSENLLLARRKEEDLERDKRWKEDQKKMFEARRKAIEAEVGIKSKEESEDGDGGGAPIDDPAEPEPFIPEQTLPEITPPGGIGPGTPTLPPPVDPSAPSPFAPLPGGPDAGGGLPPLPGGGGEPAQPSPFPPLPGAQPAPAVPGGLPPLPGAGGGAPDPGGAAPPAPSPFAPLPNQ